MARNSEFFLGGNNSTIIKLGINEVKIYMGSKLIYQPKVSIEGATVSVGAKTYNGSNQTASSITVVSSSGATLVAGEDYQVTTNSGGTNVGSYTVTVTGLGLYKGTASGTFTINKVTPTVTAPTAKVLTYNGTAQALANEGSTNFGTIEYSLDNSTWSTSIPTATNYGSYTLYYRVDGNSNVNSVSPQSIACSISEKEVTATVTLSQNTYTYSGSACTPTVTVMDGSTVIPASEYTVTYSNNTNAGTATVTITDNVGGNYNVIGSATFTIIATEATVSNAPTAKTLTYNTNAQALVNAGTPNGGTMYYQMTTSNSKPSGTTGFSTSIPTGTNAGTYYVWYYVKGDSNYTDSAISETAVSVTIAKAAGSGSVTMSGWTYGNTVTNPTPTSSTNGTESVTYAWYDTNKTALSSKPTSTSAVGTYYVKATFAATTNYEAYTTDYVLFAIAQREVTLSWGTLEWTYDGSAHGTTCTAGNLASGDTCTVTLTGNSITNAGTTTVTASSLSNSNYALPSSKTNALTITARPINVTAASASKAYDGTALTSNSATAESTGTNRGLVDGHSITSVTVTGTITTKGTANNVPSAAVIKTSGGTDVTSNYSISYVNGTLTITARAVTSTATDQSWVYDGSSHSAANTGSTTNLPTGHIATYTCSGSITNVGTATKTLSAVVIKNSGGTDVSSSFTITKVNGTLTVTTNFKPSGSDAFITSDDKYFVTS